MSIQVPILIVGAGPTGLSAALALTQLGIECLVIDKRKRAIKTSNALGVQPRTLELWEKLGIIDEALKEGHPLYGLNIYDNKQKIGFLSLKNLKTPYPFILGFPQSATEKILSDHFIAKGGKIHREWQLTSLQQNPNEVIVICENENNEKIEITTRWVLACDGARSLTRELLEIPFIGKDLPKHFIMADLPATGLFNPNEAHAMLTPEGVMAVLPLKDFYRIIFDVSKQKFLDNNKSPDLQIFTDLTKERCAFPMTLGEPIWTSSFWIHEHVVNKYFKNRVFLLGDAAHEHSPVGGQGMNTGIQDAYNLCWKLALVEKHQIERFFLSSYEQERLPVAKKVVNSTTKMTNILTTSSPTLQFIRAQLFKLATKIGWVRRAFTQTISQLNIKYKDSDFMGSSGTFRHGILPGKQMPYSPITFKEESTHLSKIISPATFSLLAFSGVDKLGDKKLIDFLNTIHSNKLNIDCYAIVSKLISLENSEQIIDSDNTLHSQYGAFHSCFYLVRPDQYIAYRSASLDQDNLKRFLDKIGFIAR